MSHMPTRITVALALLMSHTSVALAAPKANQSVSLSESIVRPGETTVLSIQSKIPKGYHLYSMTKIKDGPLPLSIEVKQKKLEAITEWHAPSPEVVADPNFKKSVEYYDGEVVHSRAFKLPRGPIVAGSIPMEIAIKGQICSGERCILVREKLEAKLTVEPGLPRPWRERAPQLKGEPFPPERPAPKGGAAHAPGAPPLGRGLLGFLLIAFLAGLGALVPPCVFPMIPITISFFSKFAKVSMRRSVTMASIYAGSIVVTFTLTGVLVSAIFGAAGMQTLSASPLFNIFLTLLLVVFVLDLLGLFEIQIPSWLVMRTSEKERDLSGDDGSLARQAAGVFFMAITFTLVSFTCTVGFIDVVLAEASKGNWFYPTVGMLAFSLAFSLPFFALAVFPSWAEKLKGKGGDWMVAVKVVLGFLELACAFKFLSNVDLIWQWSLVTRPFVLACWVVIFSLAGLYLLRVYNLPHSDEEARRVGPVRMLFACALFALAVYAATGIRDTKTMGGWLDGWLPPAVYPGQEAEAAGAGHLSWIVNDTKREMALAFLDKGLAAFQRAAGK
jgi:thiol:disulfide interchange protein DsbD